MPAPTSSRPQNTRRGRRPGRSWGACTVPARFGRGLEHGIEVVVARAHEYRPRRVVGHLLAAADEHVPSWRAHGQQRLADAPAAHHHGRLHRRRRHRCGNPSKPANRRRPQGGEEEAAEGRRRDGDGDGGFEGHLHFSRLKSRRGVGVVRW